MKCTRSKPPPAPIPRFDSLLHRLQHAPGAEDPSYLDQLMIFLEDPPPGTRDRWKEGAAMCQAWGIPSSGAAVWRLYRSQILEWRLRFAHETGDPTIDSDALEKKLGHLVALRTLEVLASPQASPACLVGLARIELRKKALALACQKHEDSRTDKIKLALDLLSVRVLLNPDAAFALEKLKAALKREIPPPSFFAAVQ